MHRRGTRHRPELPQPRRRAAAPVRARPAALFVVSLASLALATLAVMAPLAGARGRSVLASYALVGAHKRYGKVHHHTRCGAGARRARTHAAHGRRRRRARIHAAHARGARRACRLSGGRHSSHVRLLDRGSATRPGAGSSQAANARREAAATIAAVLATPCADTEARPEAQNLEAVRTAVLCLVNRERAAHGEQPLRISARLQRAAESHSRECVEDDYFAHVSPSGETPVQRIQATGYIPSPLDGYVLGENLAWGTYELGTAQSIVAAWIASPEHLANILEARYTETGVGVEPAVPASRGEGAPGATYAQEFGVIIT